MANTKTGSSAAESSTTSREKLVGQLAFSEAILRPDYGNLGGVVSVNDDTQIVTVPNPELKPEHSTKYFASLQYYLEPSGLVGLSYYKLDMKDMQVTGITVDPEDVGFNPDEYAGYTFRSAQNVPGTSTNEGLTFEYSQQLTFLPGALKGLGLFGSITRIDPDGERLNMPERAANWGVGYSYGPLRLQDQRQLSVEVSRQRPEQHADHRQQRHPLSHLARRSGTSAPATSTRRTSSCNSRVATSSTSPTSSTPTSQPRSAVHHLRLDVELRDQGHLLSRRAA